MKLLVTGAAGFIGSNFVRLVFRELDGVEVVVLDSLAYSGNRSTMADFSSDDRFKFYHGQIQDQAMVDKIVSEEKITHIVNFAAESHNDRSLLDNHSFIMTNTYGVNVILEAARKFDVERVLQVSTDEVYGSIAEGQFTEESPIEPNTPYSAAKAGGDLLCRAHFITHKTPVIVTHGGNTYGPYHYPEKIVPFFVTRLIDRKKVPLYGEGTQVREWIHVMDHCTGILTALLKGVPGEVYNVGDVNERKNIEIVSILLDELGLDDSYIKRIPDPRKGAHDARYSMSNTKLKSLGWSPQVPFETGLRATVQWFVQNEPWWREIQSDPLYQEFITEFYGRSLGEDL
ncbi:MAG: dTDP-glucose 4,6-dehydratase [Armatimonadetes bacterium]|nr:dTDP-glucose 4,6-dehydratase [Armatimonadota bacterium]